MVGPIASQARPCECLVTVKCTSLSPLELCVHIQTPTHSMKMLLRCITNMYGDKIHIHENQAKIHIDRLERRKQWNLWYTDMLATWSFRALKLSCCSLTVLVNSSSFHVPLSLLHRPPPWGSMNTAGTTTSGEEEEGWALGSYQHHHLPPLPSNQSSSTFIWLRSGIPLKVSFKDSSAAWTHLKATVSNYVLACFLCPLILRDILSAFWRFSILY